MMMMMRARLLATRATPPQPPQPHPHPPQPPQPQPHLHPQPQPPRVPVAVLPLSHEIHNPTPSVAAKSVRPLAPLVVLHGLFGSKQNWRSISKQLANKLNTSIIAVDLRNHGDSPHHPLHDYPSMAADVLALCDSLGLDKLNLMGHSMGGKTAMHMALEEQPRIANLIVVDMSPNLLNLSSLFADYVVAMRQVESANCTTQQEADAILARTIPELPIRQFISTNLKFRDGGDVLRFRVNLDAIEASFGRTDAGLRQGGIAGFPLADSGSTYTGPSLFVRGMRSGYVPDSSIPGIQRLFPKAEVVGIQDAGHWVHSEKPNEFMKVVESFLK